MNDISPVINVNQNPNVFVAQGVDAVWNTVTSFGSGTPYYPDSKKDSVTLREQDFRKVDLPDKYTNEEFASYMQLYNNKEHQAMFDVLKYEYKNNRDHFTYGTIFDPTKSPQALRIHAYRAEVISAALSKISASDMLTENSDYRLSEGQNFRILAASRRRALKHANGVPSFLKSDPWIVQELKYAVRKIKAKYPEWEAKDENGNLVPVTDENIEQMLAQPNVLKLVVLYLRHQAELAKYYSENDPYSQLASSEKHEHLMNQISGGLAGSVHDNPHIALPAAYLGYKSIQVFGGKVFADGFSHSAMKSSFNAAIKDRNIVKIAKHHDYLIKEASNVKAKIKHLEKIGKVHKAKELRVYLRHVGEAARETAKVKDFLRTGKPFQTTYGSSQRLVKSMTSKQLNTLSYAKKGKQYVNAVRVAKKAKDTQKISTLARATGTIARGLSTARIGVSSFLTAAGSAVLPVLIGYVGFEILWGIGEYAMTDKPTGMVASAIKGIVDFFKGDDGSGETHQVKESSTGLTDNRAPEAIDLNREIQELEDEAREIEIRRIKSEKLKGKADEYDPYLLRGQSLIELQP